MKALRFFLLPVLISAPLFARAAPPSVTAAGAAAMPNFVAEINRAALEKRLGRTLIFAADTPGLKCNFARRPGLRNDFVLAVYSAEDSATKALAAMPAPRQAMETPVTGEGLGGMRLWRVATREAGDEAYRVAWRRWNVVVRFDWGGTQDGASNYAREFDAALQNDAALAPRGNVTRSLPVSIVAPTVVTAATPFSVLWRCEGADIATLLQGTDRFAGRTEPLELPGGDRHSGAGEMQGYLETAGLHEIAITFVNSNGVLFDRAIPVTVIEGADAAQLTATQPWHVADKALYFTREADQQWNAVPATGRDVFGLRPGSQALTGDRAEYEQLRLWNELAGLLKRDWLPPLELVRPFKSPRNNEDTVGFVSYRHGQTKIAIVTIPDKELWIYAEQPAETTALKIASILQDKIAAAGEVPINAQPYFLSSARSFARYRSLSPGSPGVSVNFSVLHAAKPALTQVTLPKINP